MKEDEMCIPHGAARTKSNGYIEEKPKKSLKKVSQAEFEHGDPDFVDERIRKEEPKRKSSIFERLTGKK